MATSNVLWEFRRWKEFSNEVQTIQQQVDFGVLGKNEHFSPQIGHASGQ
jgi:hypothetical protein